MRQKCRLSFRELISLESVEALKAVEAGVVTVFPQQRIAVVDLKIPKPADDRMKKSIEVIRCRSSMMSPCYLPQDLHFVRDECHEAGQGRARTCHQVRRSGIPCLNGRERDLPSSAG